MIKYTIKLFNYSKCNLLRSSTIHLLKYLIQKSQLSQFKFSSLLTMKFPCFIISLVFLSFCSSPISAHFYPNISSIPRSLFPNATNGAWASFQNLSGCHAGDKVTGLAKLKQYFHYFGYINKSSDNYTDEFDEALQNALRTYQLNFNLNSTGELDESTVKQITRPRCGVADLINGSSTMNSGRAPSSSSIHGHTVAHYSFFPGRPRWPASRRDLTFAFLPDNQLTDQVRLVFTNAFDRWSEVTPLTFTETSVYFSADIRIGFFSGDHGDGEPFDGTLGTLAHAFSPPNGRLHLDGDEDWVIDGSILTSSGFAAIDLESVAVHEIGHILGLGHSSVENSIMFPTISSGSRKVELDADDIEGVQILYGSNPNYTGPTNPPGRERDTNAAHFMSSLFSPTFLLALGLATFLL